MSFVGLQSYIYNKYNKLLEAEITAAVAPSARLPLIYPVTKKGSGNIRARGNFAGADDAKYDVKIVDSAFVNPLISAPTFKGAGTGKIKDISAANMEAQKVTVLCLSTGVTTQSAVIEIEGVRFRAKASGADGNDIQITIDSSPLVFTDSGYSTIKDLKQGDTGLEGEEWNFDAKTIQGDLIPDDAHRVSFGTDTLHIYRQYKQFSNGVYKYFFIMPIRYGVKAGTKVKFVTGGRTVTVTDGVTTETYENIVTIADLWAAIRNTPSDLLEAVDTINTAMTADSPAVRELAVKTDAYALPPYKGDKSSDYCGEMLNVTPLSNTKTELIEVRCVENSPIGSELWNISGSSSGYLGQARTGDYNEFGPVGFTIPQKLPDNWGVVKEDWSYDVAYVSRGIGIDNPKICVAMRLGISSVPQTLTLTYKRRPKACSCPTVAFFDKFLGFEVKGGEQGVAYTVEDLNFWTDVTLERMRELFRSAQTRDEGEGEKTEGRESASGASYPWYQNFQKLADPYIKTFKTLAQRIMSLPENDTDALTQMVTDYKALVTSLSLWWYNGGTPKTVTWTGSAWSDNALDAVGDVTYDTAKYASLADDVLAYEKAYGVKKNSVVVASDDGSYQDSDSEYYWDVKGNKAYLPAFTDVPYYSTVKNGDAYVNTKEFGMSISVPCGGSLIEGDKITISIGGITFEHTYKYGDITYLPTVAAQALKPTGGIDGDDTYVWDVRCTVEGVLPNYLLDRNNPQAYVNAKLGLTIDEGIVMFAVGDAFSFDIEGGHWKWRKDGGAWSAAQSISNEYQALDSGIEVIFDFGVAPSFVLNDQWEVLCQQENRASNMLTPWATQRWKGTGNIIWAFDEPVTVNSLIIDMHNLTGAFTFKASNHADFSALIYSAVLTPAALICKLFDPELTAQYFKIEHAGDGEIGYAFLGMDIRLGCDASKITPTKKYIMSRQDGSEPFSISQYKRLGYLVHYQEWIENADHDKVSEMLDYLKGNNDMPLYFVPNANYPGDCIRALIDTDNVEVGMDIDVTMPKDKRIYTLSLPIVGTGV